MVKEIATLDDFKTAIGDSNTGLVVIDFWAIWCNPCRAFSSKFEAFSQKYPHVGFYKINVDNEPTASIVEACVVTGLPSFLFFKGGVYLNKTVGASEAKFEQMLLEALQTPVPKPVENPVPVDQQNTFN